MADLGLATQLPVTIEAGLHAGHGVAATLPAAPLSVITRNYHAPEARPIGVVFRVPVTRAGHVVEATSPIRESATAIAKRWNPDTEEWEPIPPSGG